MDKRRRELAAFFDVAKVAAIEAFVAAMIEAARLKGGGDE
jgi:hypothetical protein